MKGRVKDISGIKFGRLTVIKLLEVHDGNAKWLCRCECGETTNAFACNLKKGNTQSCGCFGAESRKTHDKSNTSLYHVWENMWQRCGNSNHPGYHNYGGRGIKVCDEWRSFEPFFDWATNSGYDQRLTLDRTNNEEGYEPGNCRWVDMKTQLNNTRRNVLWQGKLAVDWCSELGLKYRTFQKRKNVYGWSIEKSLFTPLKKQKEGIHCAS